MINTYYYLVASLPHLKLNADAPITKEEFLSECKKWLDSRNYQGIASIDTGESAAKKGDNEVVRGWKSFNSELSAELAKVRQMKKEGARENIPMHLKDIFEERTPLLMERRIEEKRWSFLEQQEFGYHFDIHALSLYHIKLQILERLSAFDKERGGEAFEELCEVRYE